ncbi:MAG: contact-dependent growth inhibition system immunity protein [Bacteroidia bacterium]
METLINLLDAYYNQDVWGDFSTHPEVWKDYATANPHLVRSLLTNLEEAIKLSKEELHKFIQNNSAGLSFDTPDESLSFTKELYTYLKNLHGSV